MRSLSLLSIVVCSTLALEFGERQTSVSFLSTHREIADFLDSFLTSPADAEFTNEGYHCLDNLPNFIQKETSTWLNFFLHIALHVSRLYNLGLYQDVTIGQICLHGMDKLEKVSFPESPMIAHDQGIVSVPQTAPYSSNHRVLFPFDDLAKFVRPDRPSSLLPWRFVEDRNIVNLILDSSPLKFLSSFSMEAQQRLLIPLHPIYMVRDLYHALLAIKAPDLDKNFFTQIEDQIRLSNPHLPSPIPLPLPQISENPLKTILNFPITAQEKKKKEHYLPLEFSVKMLPLDESSLRPNLSDPKDVDTPPISNPQQSTDSGQIKEKPETSEGLDLASLVNPATFHDNKQSDKKEKASPSIKKIPLFRSNHKSVHQGMKKAVFDNTKNVHLLHKNKQFGSYLMSKKDIQKRVLAKKVIEVSHARDYYAKHYFFSPYIHQKGSIGQSFFAIRRFIKSTCQMYQNVDAPLIDIVCKKKIPPRIDLNIFNDQSEGSLRLLLSWFTTFLSGESHLLDRFRDAPSLLKAQLFVILKMTLAYLKNRFENTDKTSLTFQNRLKGHRDFTQSLFLKEEGLYGPQGELWNKFFSKINTYQANRKTLFSKTAVGPSSQLLINPNWIIGLSFVDNDSPRRVAALDVNIGYARFIPHPLTAPYGAVPDLVDNDDPQFNTVPVPSVIEDKRGGILKPRRKDAYYGCGLIFSALLHYFAVIITPSPHALPLPQMLSLRQGQMKFDYEGNNYSSLPNIPVLSELSQLYNRQFFSSIGINTLLPPFRSRPSYHCLVDQYLSRDCQDSINIFHGPSAASHLSAHSALFLTTASRLYKEAISLSEKLLPLVLSIEHHETLSLFYLFSVRLLPLDKEIWKNASYFGFLLAFLSHYSGLINPIPKFFDTLCRDNLILMKEKLFQFALDTFNFDILSNAYLVCQYESSLESHSTFKSLSLLIKQLFHLQELLHKNVEKELFMKIFTYWAFSVREDILAGNQHIYYQHPLLFFTTVEGSGLWKEFLHDAALLQTIGSTSQTSSDPI